MKACTKCKIQKPPADYYTRKSLTCDVLYRAKCKACVSKAKPQTKDEKIAQLTEQLAGCMLKCNNRGDRIASLELEHIELIKYKTELIRLRDIGLL